MSEVAAQKTQVVTLQLSVIEQRLRGKDIKQLKSRVAAILDKVPHKAELPEWDRLD